MAKPDLIKADKLQGGRETDALVSEKLMGQPVCTCRICVDTGPNGMCENCSKPRGRFYSTHTEKALSLLEHLAGTSGYSYRIERSVDKKGDPSFEVSLSEGKTSVSGTAPTMALAACRAALKTVKSK